MSIGSQRWADSTWLRPVMSEITHIHLMQEERETQMQWRCFPFSSLVVQQRASLAGPGEAG